MNSYKKHEHVIWDNYDINLDDWQEFLEEEYPDVTDEFEKYLRICEMNDEYLEDERMNLDKVVGQRILVLADVGRWDGRKHGYKFIGSGNIKDCLYMSNGCEYAKWWVDGHGNLRCNESHHDGTNHLLYRVVKPNVRDTTIEKIVGKWFANNLTSGDLTLATESVGRYIGEIYGWR